MRRKNKRRKTRSRRLLLESLTSRQVLTGPFELTIFVDSEEVSIPANIGVDSSGGSLSPIRTDASGNPIISPIGSESVEGTTLGDFFETWRTNAGVAGNNSAATFDEDELLGNVRDATSTVKMFVNGQVNEDFEGYVIQENDEIVLAYGENPVISINTNFGPILMELFEEVAPGTVENFLNYVNDGDYINSFFHRSADNQDGSDFVIQGGGFVTNSTTFTNISQFSSVPTDAPIQNEPNLSNLRGTVAMAKTSNPDSATSQFFVNLSDQNTFLDNPNNSGGFTVFAQVLDLTTSDAIADLPIRVNDSPYRELPVSNDNQLVVIQSIEGHSRFSGTKFTDTNGNGVRDAGEAGLSNIRVYLDENNNGVFDSGEQSTLTDSSGRYLLEAEAGTYTIRAETTSGQSDTTPNGRHTVVGEIGTEVTGLDFGQSAFDAPTGIDLVAASDTGAANNDNLTRLNNADSASTLRLEVSGVTPGATVRIFSDGVQIGSAVASATTVTVETDGVNALADGSRALTATQTINGSESSSSPSLTINIDTTAPADFTNTAPNVARPGETYSHNVASPDEDQTGTTYSIENAPSGMTIDADDKPNRPAYVYHSTDRPGRQCGHANG
ncbi:MAG: peptidylprolyl isomerase [Pirellulales bacterium]|nr:peptidylprolyl isomerase [Pirellulales bacterium]